MQFIIKTSLTALILVFPFLSFSQSTYLPQGDKHEHLLERLEIKLQRNSDLNAATVKPLSRKIAVRIANYADSVQQATGNLLNSVDQYGVHSLLMNNSEWVEGDKSSFKSRHPVWNTFYKTKANMLEADVPDFFIATNPVFQGQLSVENDNDQQIFVNTKGITTRGMIARRVGFSAFLTDNQERGPLFVQDRIAETEAVPGEGYYKHFKVTAKDYFDARASLNFTAAKYLDFQFGYDKNFIGAGYRSLFLSDFGASYLFAKIHTRIWKIDYLNLFMELTPQYKKGSDHLLDKKYAAIRHLSFNAAKWLNLGLFEAVVFGRKNHFDFTYLNPIMFLRVAEQQNGSADNALMGLDFKANVAKKFQFYGQWLLDEFKLSEVKAGNGWWANKFGFQFGAKYIDVFNIPNLDLQGELNMVRPFTYTHNDSVSNYTHYNQPLAHPFGANFREAIGIVRYQPHPKWNASARLIVWEKGIDSADNNFGGDIFKPYSTRGQDYGYFIPSGVKSTGINAQLLVSYQVLENVFLDASVLLRRLRVDADPSLNRNTSLITGGVRVNMFRREYDY